MTTKRANGEGTVTKDAARGTWVGRVTIDGKRHKVRAATRVDVMSKMNALRAAADRGEALGDGNATVGDATKRWRDRELAARTMAPATRVRYEWALDMIDNELATTRLRRLDVDTVEGALDNIASGRHGRGQPLSKSSLGRVRDTLRMVLDFAVRRKMLASNPAALAVVTPTAPPAKKRRALDPAQAAQLWAALDGQRLGPLVKVMLTTGLRPGEALGLCWDAVDLDHARLTVRRAVHHDRGRAVLVEQLKTTASYRTIGLPAPAVEVLREQRRTVAAMKLAARSWVPDDPGLVFPTVTGNPWDLSNVRQELAAICRAAELPVITPNELRHSCATVLSDAGVPLELIADLLGHTTTRMLDQHYRHRVRPSVDVAMDVMGELFGNG